MSQKAAIFILAAARTWNLTQHYLFKMQNLQAFVGLVTMSVLIVTSRQAASCKQKRNTVKEKIKYRNVW